jgi:hypothetical protein
MPATKFQGPKDPVKNPMAPPRRADRVPIYGPRSTPITGAVIAAAVMLLLGMPSNWKIGIDAKTAYNAVKHITKAISFVLSPVLIGITTSLICCCEKLIIRNAI